MTTENVNIVISERGSRAVRRNIEDIGKGAATAQGAVSLLNRTLGLIGLGVGIESFIRLSDAATTSRNRLAVLGTTVETTQKRLDLLNQIANNSGQSIESLVGLFQKGAIAAKDLGASEKDLFTFVKAVSDVLRIQGTSAEESKGALLQLSQALSTGIVRAEEFNSIMENAFPLAIAAAQGIKGAAGSVGQLRLMIIKGKVSSKEFFEAVISQSGRLSEEAIRANLTISQSFTVLRNKLVEFTGKLNEATGINRMFSDAILTVAANLDKLFFALTALAGVTAFNFLTRQVLMFGAVVKDVLTFLTLGIVRVAAIFAAAFLPLAAATLLFAIFKDEITDVINHFGGLGAIGEKVMSAISDSLELLVVGFTAAYRTIIKTFGKLPAALGDLVSQAVNNALEFLHAFAGEAIRLFNKLPGINISPLKDFEGMKNEFAGAASEVGDIFNKEFDKALGENHFDKMKKDATDFVGFIKNAVPKTVGTKELTDMINGLSGKPLAGTPSVLDPGAQKKGPKTFADYKRELGYLLETVQMTEMEREKKEKLFKIEDQLIRSKQGITAAQKQELSSLLDLIQAKKDEQSMYEEITGAQDDFARKQGALNRIFEAGRISVEQYADKLRQLKIVSLETARDMATGFERGLLKVEESFGNVATVAEDAMLNSMKSIEDAFVEMATTGKFQFHDLVDTIFAEITRLAVRQSITEPITRALSGNEAGIGGMLSGLLSPNGVNGIGGFFSGFKNLLGFANGGEFEVGGSGHAPDTQLVQFKATKGEKVYVRPKGMDGSGNDRPINVNYNISTPDANSFTRSQGQILAKTQSALARANRRNS